MNGTEAACNGKTRHGSFTAASKSLERRRGLQGSFQIYRCKVCRQWHIGNGMEPKSRKAIFNSRTLNVGRE